MSRKANERNSSSERKTGVKDDKRPARRNAEERPSPKKPKAKKPAAKKDKPKTAKDANEPASKPGKGKDKGKGKAAEKDSAKGNGHQQQLKALEEQTAHEETKHRERVARLERIRELAEEEGNTKTVERVNKLLGKEQQRYERKQQRMEKRKQKILQIAEAVCEDEQESVEKGKGKAKGKGKNKVKSKDTDKHDACEEAEE